MDKAKLRRLERAARELAARPCGLCYSALGIVLTEENESDPDGPGYRHSGRRWLDAETLAKITPDFRCSRCGAEPVLFITLQTIKGIGSEPEGVLIQSPSAKRRPPDRLDLPG